MRRDLPTGTVTFLFTDVEGSTRLLHEVGAEDYAQALAEHRRVLRDASSRHGGVEVDTQGDAFFVAFPTASGAVEAAREAQDALADGPIRVRMGIHTGTPLLAGDGYVGADVHRAARIAAVGHGGQVLVSATTASLLGTNGLLDLGNHRLKDLSSPERIYQLGEGDFPPLSSLHQTNLPVPATPFLGRERELEEVRALLTRDDVRLLTLSGPGGTGKTRLALQAAGAAADAFPHGIWWVPLAPLREPRLVLETAAHAVGAKNGLAEHVGDKSMLILFDNFEHLVEASDHLSALLAACPHLRLLVTSRELLAVPGEQAYSVPPLDPHDGTELFLARAHAAMPSFEASAAVPELCARLDNLPLALELAAARVRVLSPEQLLERLAKRLDLLKSGRGADPRQRTLRATIEWSHDLLSGDEQTLFRRLAVFRGGCTLKTAEEIADADLDTLQSLVDKSLVRVREGERFWMLETIREYAGERLRTSGEAEELHRRHAEYFIALAEEAFPFLRGSPKEWLDRLDEEHDNLRGALDWLAERCESELALQLAGALYRFWHMRGYFAEGRRRVEGTLAVDGPPTPARGRALHGAAVMAGNTGDPATVRMRAEEALAVHRGLGDPWGIAYSRFLMAFSAEGAGDFESARQLFEESVEAFREAGDEHYTLLASDGVAWMCGMLGDDERRRALHEDILRQARAQSDDVVIALTLDQLAGFAVKDGRIGDALSMLKEALAVARELGAPDMIAEVFARFADVLTSTGRAETAALLLAQAESLRAETGGGEWWVAEHAQEALATVRTQLDERSLEAAWAQGRSMTLDDAVALALES